MGTPQPEDGSPLHAWRTRRLIRNIVWMVGGLLIVYLLGLSLHQARENADLYRSLQRQADAQVSSLAEILVRVQAAETAARDAGREASITFEQAVAALKAAFPAGAVDEAVQRALSTTTTTTTRPRSTTTTSSRGQATTTTTAGIALPVPTTSTTARPPPPSTSSTTTTVRPCAVGVSVPGLIRLCL